MILAAEFFIGKYRVINIH